jgi:hypothetical protein
MAAPSCRYCAAPPLQPPPLTAPPISLHPRAVTAVGCRWSPQPADRAGHSRPLPAAAMAEQSSEPPLPYSAVPNHRRHSRVHYRLRLMVIHLTHMLARAKHRQSAAATMSHGCKPPAHVAEPPRAVSGQAEGTVRCALGWGCSTATPWPLAWPPPARAASFRRPPCFDSHQGPRTTILLKGGVFLQNL